MAKKFNKKSTLMNRMGFRDPDLKLQSHDDIILWLYQDKIIKKIGENFYKSKGWEENFDNTSILKELEYIIKKTTEYSEYDIGFIDLVVVFKFKDRKTYSQNFELSPKFNFEVKTSYPSLGELLRQLNMYHKYLNGFFFLVGPKNKKIDNFPEILENHGWIFIEIPEELQNEKKKPQRNLSNFNFK